MSISIFTYSNPYRINKEKYWNRIKDAFQLCASQTLVNGLCDQYPEFYIGKLTTINNFINKLYVDWEDPSLQIRQRAEIDHILNSSEITDLIPSVNDNALSVESLRLNRENIYLSLRIMFELGIDPQNVLINKLTNEQKTILNIYTKLITSGNPFFKLPKIFKESEIAKAIDETINDIKNDPNRHLTDDKIESIDRKTIVIHGIHQFTPIMLRTVELLSNYCDVIMLFNYQPDFKNIYQTWMEVYGCFESNIIQSSYDWTGSLPSSYGKTLARNLSDLANGNTLDINFNNDLSITEFNNVSEFSNYIAARFEEAEKRKREDNFAHPTLYYMDEQIYSANSSVNDILKIYFPEQFGERQFLDYPIGHFFAAVANMWNPDTQKQEISDLNDLKDCLACGILSESSSGELLSIYNKTYLYFENESTIKGIISRLKDLLWKIESIDEDSEYDFARQIEYCTATKDEVNKLIKALQDLDDICDMFYADFSANSSDFKAFYSKIVDILQKHVLPDPSIDEEFKDIVQRVLQTLDEVADTEVHASFECLKDTMEVYLQQRPDPGKSANWIVRNFEQIDGDSLRKNNAGNNRCYHFACMSDKDMSVSSNELFPWPLDIHFFEVAQNPVDWKYQVYVRSKQEYKNFKRYALVYGLSFCNCKIKLSYIKNEDDEITEPYYMLRILNAHVVRNEDDLKNKFFKNDSSIQVTPSTENQQYTEYDLMKYRLCPYRFLLETIAGNGSVYSDQFLLNRFASIVLENRARLNFQGTRYSEYQTHNFFLQEKQTLEEYLSFLTNLEWMDIISKAENDIKKITGRKFYSRLNKSDIEHMKEMELFMATSDSDKKKFQEVFKSSTQAEVDEELSEQNISSQILERSNNSICCNCSVRNLCLEIYRHK